MDTVLCFGGSASTIAALGVARPMGDGELHVSVAGGARGARREIAVLVERDVARAMRRLAARPVDVIVIDGRDAPDASDVVQMLERLFPRHDSSGPARRQRTLVLVAGDANGARLAYAAGRHRVAAALVAPTSEEVLARILAMTARDDAARIAVCLAGGGIEGLLYEVGVLRALDHFLDEERRVCDLDLFCGISAGAMIGSLLANGLSPAEIAEGLRRGTDKLDRITRREIFDPNFREVGSRALGFLKDVVGLGEARNPISALYRAVPSAAFAGDGMRRYMARQLAKPGMSDRFDTLRRPLLIGATDQDSSEAVVFGEPGWRDVPVHQAVRASCALAPFFTPEKIGGRLYVDGAFSRTTNMRVAVKHGATMVVIVDPLVPIQSEVPGYVQRRGGIFGTMQGLKALINGRFDKAEGAIREMYPDVAFHLFRPEGDEMRILSGSPMKFLYREEIEELAYQRTLRKIRAQLPQMSRDFARHGVLFREPPRPSGRSDAAASAFADALVAA